MTRRKNLYIAGAHGLVGQALCRAFKDHDILAPTRAALDLRDQGAVARFLSSHKPDAIIMAAGTVGGIADNAARPADYLYDNIMMATNIIHAAHLSGIDRLLYLGSSCTYPRMAAQPISEDALLSGPLEPTNEAYALGKIAGVKLCQSYRAQYKRDYIAAMPCNLYGPGDRYDAMRSHVIPALILKIKQARAENRPSINLWGSGQALREFMHVDDLARALRLLLDHYHDTQPVNVGSGQEITIAGLAATIARHLDYRGELCFDHTMPDGTPRKILDSRTIRALGWQPNIDLDEGLAALCHMSA